MSAEGAFAPRYPVAIVGAGPTGLMLANLLGRYGTRALLIERNAETVGEPRAVSIDDETLRSVQAVGLLDSVMQDIVPGYGSRYQGPDGRTFLTVEPSGRPYGHPRRNAFRQPRFEAALRNGLERFTNINTGFGWTLEGFVDDVDGVRLRLRNGDRLREVECDYLIGCDGASSAVRKALGVALEGRTLPERWLIVDLEDSPAPERRTIVFCDPARPCIALPGPHHTRRFEFKLHRHESEADLLEPAVVARLLNAHGVASGSRIVRTVVYTFHARVAERWSAGRVYLAGDAAHLTPPFAGQGMNSGVRDAHNLAWKLAWVTAGRLPASLLDSYERERRDHAASMIELALRMGRIMGPPSRLAAWAVQTAFRLAGAVPRVRAYFGEMKYKPKPRIREGFLLERAHPLVGRLVPQPVVRGHNGRETPLDALLGDGFALVGVDVERLAEATAQPVWDSLNVRRLTLRLDPAEGLGRDEVSVTAPGLAGVEAGTVLLVRPDRYVMAAFSLAEAELTAGALARAVASLGSPRSSTKSCVKPPSNGRTSEDLTPKTVSLAR